MIFIKRGSTPTLLINKSADVKAYASVVFTLQDSQNNIITISNPAIKDNAYQLNLSQSDTLMLNVGNAKLEAQYIFEDKTAITFTYTDIRVLESIAFESVTGEGNSEIVNPNTPLNLELIGTTTVIESGTGGAVATVNKKSPDEFGNVEIVSDDINYENSELEKTIETKQNIVHINSTGKKFNLTILDDGTIKTTTIPILDSELPEDFPRVNITKRSGYKGNFLITPHSNNYDSGYVFIINEEGNVLQYHKTNAYCSAFRKFRNSKGENRYCYLETISKNYPTSGGAMFYEHCELVVLNENFIEIDRVRGVAHGDITKDFPVENHDYSYIDDGHYIVAFYYRLEGDNRYYNAFEEIKNRKVLWYWSTRDYPELLDLSHDSAGNDYAHFNSIKEDYDGNYLVSFRNIGIVKINKITKKIMWVIGEKRNDFSGLASTDIPYQQHDIQLVKTDGSFTIFDNFGHDTNSRICRYNLNESTMQATYKEYVTSVNKSQYMGSAKLLDEKNSTFLIAYGSGWNFGFEERNFHTNTREMALYFADGYDLYEVFKDISDMYVEKIIDSEIPQPEPTVNREPLHTALQEAEILQESLYTAESWIVFAVELSQAQSIYIDSNATQTQIDNALVDLQTAQSNLVIIAPDLPIPTYSLSNQIFDGTNYVDTGIDLFKTEHPFTIIVKATFDIADNMKVSGDYGTLIHCMNEVSPWPGLAIQGLNSGGIRTLDAVGRLTSSYARNFYKDNVAGKEFPDGKATTYFVFVQNNKHFLTNLYTQEKVAPIAAYASTVGFASSDTFDNPTLWLGATNMLGTPERFFVGEINQFNYYDSRISDVDITEIIQYM